MNIANIDACRKTSIGKPKYNEVSSITYTKLL